MTGAEIRAKDPAVQQTIQYLASRNFSRLEIDACFKILTEGADGRFLKEATAWPTEWVDA